ncbi:MAG: hypothetical protein M1837_003261 [Sclerophora amabilis]|nr:MAG: hypothetical protein M1837_003261 [Sclerophora amabilis]
MPPRKAISKGSVAAPTPNATPTSLSRLPHYLRFPLLIFANLVLSSALYSLASDYTAGDLGSVSRSFDAWWEVTALIGWRAAELAVGWLNNYDGIDLASLILLSHLPPLYLLTTFYHVRPGTIVLSLAIDVISTYVPFRLLRPMSAAHNPNSPKSAVSNRSVINDVPIMLYTTLLAAAVYSTTVYASFKSWIPVHLVTYFDGLRDMSGAHSPALPMLAATFIPMGFAAKEFIFIPATATHPDPGDDVSSSFNPETATFSETFRYNAWGFSSRTKVIITRTATLMLVSGLNTWMQTFVTVEGVESYGAIGWSALWVAAEALTGIMFWWVGDV